MDTNEPPPVPNPIVHPGAMRAPMLGELTSDGQILTTRGWSKTGPAWVTEDQIPPTVGYGWTRTGKTAHFQGLTLHELVNPQESRG